MNVFESELLDIAEAGTQAFFDNATIEECPYTDTGNRHDRETRRYFSWTDAYLDAQDFSCVCPACTPSATAPTP